MGWEHAKRAAPTSIFPDTRHPRRPRGDTITCLPLAAKPAGNRAPDGTDVARDGRKVENEVEVDPAVANVPAGGVGVRFR